MNLTDLEKFATKKLLREIKIIQNSYRNIQLPQLTIHEKAIIYKYTEDGYESLNEILRDSEGKRNIKFGRFLNIILDKLPVFEGLVYRSSNLTPTELKRYFAAMANSSELKEYSFISTSKSRLIAMAFNGNVLFRIYSRTGKEIEKIAKFGVSDAQNEKEVLFKSNTKFKILNITAQTDYSLITMEEISYDSSR